MNKVQIIIFRCFFIINRFKLSSHEIYCIIDGEFSQVPKGYKSQQQHLLLSRNGRRVKKYIKKKSSPKYQMSFMQAELS